jgi:hypothetical protein
MFFFLCTQVFWSTRQTWEDAGSRSGYLYLVTLPYNWEGAENNVHKAFFMHSLSAASNIDLSTTIVSIPVKCIRRPITGWENHRWRSPHDCLFQPPDSLVRFLPASISGPRFQSTLQLYIVSRRSKISPKRITYSKNDGFAKEISSARENYGGG